MRIAMVVQRYGTEVTGGAELECRQVAERMSAVCEVEVFTTCSLDYSPWDNSYPSGLTVINSVKVNRFPLDRIRNHARFDTLNRRVLQSPHDFLDELDWVRELGPHSRDLLLAVESNRDAFDLWVFFTYQYFSTVFGLPIAGARSVLVPTAHDEPTIRLSVYRPVFELPSGIVYNSEAERMLVESRFAVSDKDYTVAGAGVDLDAKLDANDLSEDSRDTPASPFVLVLGRIEPAKGSLEAVEFFRRYKLSRPESRLKLVLAGRSNWPIPDHRDIIQVGFVSEEKKRSLLRQCIFLLVPSTEESLSIVTLEAWAARRAVLVNSLCEVTREHCRAADGGLHFSSYEEFARCVDLLAGRPDVARTLGVQGREFVEQRYRWDDVLARYLSLFERVAGRAATAS